jgi:hypothetical protein
VGPIATVPAHRASNAARPVERYSTA